MRQADFDIKQALAELEGDTFSLPAANGPLGDAVVELEPHETSKDKLAGRAAAVARAPSDGACVVPTLSAPPSPPEEATGPSLLLHMPDDEKRLPGDKLGGRNSTDDEIPTRRRRDSIVSYASLDESLLNRSLSESLRLKNSAAVRKILLGWSLSVCALFAMLATFACYGCLLFEDRRQEADDALLGNTTELLIRRRLAAKAKAKRQRPPGNSDELIIAWALSSFQRFVLHEPALILAAKGLPILFASEVCANFCGEAIVGSLSLMFTCLMQALKRLKA